MKQGKNSLLAAVSAAFAASAFLAPAAVLIAPSAAHAAEKQTIGAKVGKPLQDAKTLADQKKWTEAIAKAKEADAIVGKSAYEDFVVKDFLTFLYVNVLDYGNAAVAAEAALNSGQAPANDVQRRTKLLAQLYYSSKNYGKALEYAEKYSSKYGSDSQISDIVVQGYYLQKNYSKALALTLDAVQDSEKAGRTPGELILQIALSSAYNLKDNAKTKDLLFLLVQYHPSNEYWGNLFDMLLTSKGGNERSNLELFRAKYAAGVMKDASDYEEAGQTAIQLGLPGEAQRFIQAGFDKGILGVGPNAGRQKRLQTLANTQAAQDKATIAAQAKQAAASPNGTAAVKVAEALESYGDAAGALTLIQSGIAKPGIKNLDEARVTLGRIQYVLGQKDDARKTFADVKTDPKMTDVAHIWTILSRKK